MGFCVIPIPPMGIQYSRTPLARQTPASQLVPFPLLTLPPRSGFILRADTFTQRRNRMVADTSVEEMTAVLDLSFRESFDAESRALFRQLPVLLAEGKPLSVEHVAEALGQPRDE